jgi:hypothetical protein
MKLTELGALGQMSELAIARAYSFHAIPLKLQMGERLMSPRRRVRGLGTFAERR